MAVTYESAATMARELTGGQKFMKYVIIILAGLYLIFGIVLCSVGGAALSGYAANIAGSSLPTGLIVIGVFLIVTSLVGAGSAWKEFRVGLAIYFGAMLLWTVILLAIGIAILAVKNNLQTYIASGWANLDCGTQQTIQLDWSCCGRYSMSDWYFWPATGWNSNTDNLSGYGFAPGNISNPTAAMEFATFPTLYCQGNTQTGCPGPYSAGTTLPNAPSGTQCILSPSGTLTQAANPNCLSSAPGCVPALLSSLQSQFNTAGACGIAFAIIMAIGLAFICLLMRGIQTRGTNAAIEKNRAKSMKDVEEKRRRGKGGLKIPDTVL